MKVIGCKWVFQKKGGSKSTSAPVYKVKVVAKGFTQVEGVDFLEVFSPVLKHSSNRGFVSYGSCGGP